MPKPEDLLQDGRECLTSSLKGNRESQGLCFRPAQERRSVTMEHMQLSAEPTRPHSGLSAPCSVLAADPAGL